MSSKMHEHWTQKGGSLVAKKQFKTLDEAFNYMNARNINLNIYHPYVCSECGMWHIGHYRTKK